MYIHHMHKFVPIFIAKIILQCISKLNFSYIVPLPHESFEVNLITVPNIYIPL